MRTIRIWIASYFEQFSHSYALCDARTIIRIQFDDCVYFILINSNQNILMQQSAIDIKLSKDPALQKCYEYLMTSFVRLAHLLRHSSDLLHQGVDSANHFGDIQLDTDLHSEEIINQELKNSGVVSYSLNEETPEPTKLGDGPLIVTFDPLDGSSVIGQNWAVGTIVGIWPHDDKILVGKTGRAMIGGCCCIYGPRLSMVYYNDITDCVDELAYLEFGKETKWVVTKKDCKINKKGKLFSPGNIRAASDNKAFKKLIDNWIEQGYTMRYAGSMAADIYQLFIKETGIFCCMVSKNGPAKLRYLYEVAPLGYLVERAGGKSTDGYKSVLDTTITGFMQKGPISVGTPEEIAKVELAQKAYDQELQQ